MAQRPRITPNALIRLFVEEHNTDMFVQFWPVGQRDSSYLPMSVGNIAAHLLVDWVPSLPPAVGSAFIGWPPFLIGSQRYNGNMLLVLREIAGRSERQWKTVLSWMLGVAGTRQFLASEGYRWIAPLSAFYEDAVQPVDLSQWNPAFPPTSIKANRPSGSRTRLRPDYLALRPTTQSGQFDWAVVESKGTHNSLKNLHTCRSDWANQVRNIDLTINNVPIPIQRHLVVATRVNPNAAHPFGRRLQIRAWNNRNDVAAPLLPPQSAVEIVAAQVFGLFVNLGLQENARAIAIAVAALNESQPARLRDLDEDPKRIFEAADREIIRRSQPADTGGQRGMAIRMDTGVGPLEVTISEAILNFARKFRSIEAPEQLATLLKEIDSQLDDRPRIPHEEQRHDLVTLPFGIDVLLPERFTER